MTNVHNYIKYYENIVDEKLCDDIINKIENYLNYINEKKKLLQ